MDENRIKALQRHWSIDLEALDLLVPKILYVCVRRRAHAYVMEQGMKSEGYLVLSPDRTWLSG